MPAVRPASLVVSVPLLALLVAASPQELHGPNTCTLAALALVQLQRKQEPIQARTPTSGLTLPSSGPAYGRPLKSNVSALARQMKKSVVQALASGDAAFKRSEQLPLRRLHSRIGATRHGVLRDRQLFSAGSRRAPASRASGRVSLSERFGTDRHPLQGSEQYTLGQVSLACARSNWRSSRAELQFNQRANPSFKRTRLRRSA